MEVEPELIELVSMDSQLEMEPVLIRHILVVARIRYTRWTHLWTVSQALRFSRALLRMLHQTSLSSLLSADSKCLRMVM